MFFLLGLPMSILGSDGLVCKVTFISSFAEIKSLKKCKESPFLMFFLIFLPKIFAGIEKSRTFALEIKNGAPFGFKKTDWAMV